MLTHAQLATLAQDAYERAPTWQAKENPRARAMLDTYFNAPVISIPGTDPSVPDDLVTDADCEAAYLTGVGNVHAGFQRIATQLYPYIVATVFPGGAQIPQVTLTGHSLGGAVAMVLAALMQRDGLAKSITLVTFGCPRVGAQRLAATLWNVRKTLYRFGNDPIPEVPWILWHQFPPVLMMHPTVLTPIGITKLELLSNHDISNYVSALTDLRL